MLVFLQYSSLAAQYSSPGQQYHPTLGQHPPGHSVPGQSCLTIFLGAAMDINFSAMLVFLQYSSLAAQYSSPGQQYHPTLGQHPPGHSVPGQSCLTIFFGCSHGHQFLSNVSFFAVFFTCCTVFISRTAIPSNIGATSTWAFSSGTILFNNFFGCSHGHQFL